MLLDFLVTPEATHTIPHHLCIYDWPTLKPTLCFPRSQSFPPTLWHRPFLKKQLINTRTVDQKISQVEFLPSVRADITQAPEPNSNMHLLLHMHLEGTWQRGRRHSYQSLRLNYFFTALLGVIVMMNALPKPTKLKEGRNCRCRQDLHSLQGECWIPTTADIIMYTICHLQGNK